MMAQVSLNINNYYLASAFSQQILLGSAFAFIDTKLVDNNLKKGFDNFYGTQQKTRKTLALYPNGKALPGCLIKPQEKFLSIAPVLLSDKEIYRLGQEIVNILVIAPAWLWNKKPSKAELIVENNGQIYRQLSITINSKSLTLVKLDNLPEGSYRVYWDSQEAENSQGQRAECRFHVVEYVLSPLQATLLSYQLQGINLKCCLKIEQFHQLLNQPVKIEVVSGENKLKSQTVKPSSNGQYEIKFTLEETNIEGLELNITYQELTATVIIPGSKKAEREDTLLSGLGGEVTISLMPQAESQLIRGLYVNDQGIINNTPVVIADIFPENQQTQLQWRVDVEAARLLIFDLAGNVLEERDLGNIQAGEGTKMTINAPGCIIVVGAWIDKKAWEGWSIILTPERAKLALETPLKACPGETITIKLNSNYPASVYLRVKDIRLSGANPQTRLAANLKQGIEDVNHWGTLGYVEQSLQTHPDFAVHNYDYYSQPVSSPPLPIMQSSPGNWELIEAAGNVPPPMPTAPMRAKTTIPASAFTTLGGATEDEEDIKVSRSPRRDFGDVAYCEVINTNEEGVATIPITLPDAITSYLIEAFAISEQGTEWATCQQELAVSQAVWAELKLPVYLYPQDVSLGLLHVGCESGEFKLKLLCNNQPVSFTLVDGETNTDGIYLGKRAKVEFEVKPGKWRVEIEDVITGKQDISEKIVMALGEFKGIAKRFQLLLSGETINRREIEARQLRLLPSLDQPFKLLCDATANYSHHCCEQTAAKIVSAVAGLLAGGDPIKLGTVIKIGVEREKKMHLPGQGLMMYPPEEYGGSRQPNQYWGIIAAEHLLSLANIGESSLKSLDQDIQNSLQTAIAIGVDVAQAYHLPTVPVSIKTGQDTYRILKSFSKDATFNPILREKVLTYVRDSINKILQGEYLKEGAVFNRQELAYCSATLLAGGEQRDLALAIKVANQIANSLDENGRLYSTIDSVALISLMSELKTAGITSGKAIISLDEQEMTLGEALAISGGGEIDVITVKEGIALVEITTEILEDWNSFQATLPVKTKLKNLSQNLFKRGFHLGDSLELTVTVDKYEPGLILQVCLPPCLSRLEGGGEVKRFALDFCGHNHLTVPLQVTGTTLKNGEHWAILVRNMFKEEQIGNPGLLNINCSHQ